MLSSSKLRTTIPAASWRRELLQPAVSLLWTSIFLCWATGLMLFLIPLFIVTVWVSARYPDVFLSGRFFKRSSPSQIKIRRSFSAIERATNGVEDEINTEQIETHIRLPEISTAPKWIQYLIAYAGAPISMDSTTQKNSDFYDGMIYAIPFMAGFILIITATFLINTHTPMGPLSKWFWLLLPLLGMLLLSYRLSFRRLHDIYTADAAKTGRHAFPALRH